MTTPTKSMILEKAVELFHNDRFRAGEESFNITPTEAELAEDGYISAAQSELMRNLATKNSEWESYDPTEILDFEIDVEQALKNGTYTCGTRGCGKSDLNMMLADKLIEAGIICCIFDPSRDWLKRGSIEKYITVKPHAKIEIPFESQIYDLSVLTLKQQKEFVESFNRALFDYQITHGLQWYFCIYEEAHMYFYQGVLRSNEMQYTVRLLTQGRNFKISMALITQFSAMLDKDTMKFMEQRFFGASNEPNDTEYITRFFPKNEREKIEETLQKLSSGQFLNMQKQIIQIQPYEGTTTKTEIVSDTTPTQQPLPKIVEPQLNYQPLLKAGVIGFIGLLFLLLTIGAI